LRDPTSHRQDIYHFINRPIPRLLRYNLLLADILKSLKEVGPENHPDIETIPQVMELIGDLGKATQKGVAVNEAKVELWTFQHSLDGTKFGPRVVSHELMKVLMCLGEGFGVDEFNEGIDTQR
jgi:hypothetical protein